MNRRTAIQLVAALALLLSAATVLKGTSAEAAPAPFTSKIDLLYQTPWVVGSGTFHVQLGIGNAPDGARLQVMIFGRLLTRSDFDRAAAGHVNGYSYYHPAVAVTKLPPDPAGGFDVDIPVALPQRPGGLWPSPGFVGAGPGVYPVELQLASAAGVAVASPIYTFLTYASNPAGGDDGRPLTVALVVPYSTALPVGPGGDVVAPGPGELTRLDQLAKVLEADSSVPASVQADPLTLSALRAGAGSPEARDALADLAGVPQGNLVEVLPSTYAPVRPGDLAAAGLAREVGPQLDAGRAVLSSVFGVAPAQHTWVSGGPVDPATVSQLAGHGITRLGTPDSDLSALPAIATEYTFAYQATLVSGADRMAVMAADPSVSADFSRPGSAVLDGNLVLAELAMIQMETPGNARGILVMPPDSGVVDPATVSTILAGLDADPLLTATTLSDAFDRVPEAKGGLVRSLAPAPSGPAPALALAADAGRILAARAEVSSLGALLGVRHDQASAAAAALLVAEAPGLPEATRRSILAGVSTLSRKLTGAITLPGASNITLTATQGQLPLTILSSSPLHPRVELHLESQRLIFRPFRPPGGECRVPTPTKEICTFSLGTQNTTLSVPVETRASGVFPLIVDLYAPGTGLLLSHERDTVRSTAVSGVGVVLIITAVVSLALWWARDLRHGRRPRGMVPSPADLAEVSPKQGRHGPIGTPSA